MPPNRLTKSAFYALQPGQRIAYSTFLDDYARYEVVEGVVTHAPPPPEHPTVCSNGGITMFMQVIRASGEPDVVLDMRQVEAVLSPPDPTLAEELAAWLRTRRPAALRQERARLVAHLVAYWTQASTEPVEEEVEALPYSLGEGRSFKLVGNRGRRVGEIHLAEGRLRMRAEALRGRAISALELQGVHLPSVRLDRPYAPAGCRVRGDGRWTIHPVVDGELYESQDLAVYDPVDGTLTCRHIELGALLEELVARHGWAVTQVEAAPPRRPMFEVSGLSLQRWQADADISELKVLLGRPPADDDWPFAVPRDSPPRRELTKAAKAFLPQEAAAALTSEWKTPHWWWSPGLEGGWDNEMTSERFQLGAWSAALQDWLRVAPASPPLPPEAEGHLAQWCHLAAARPAGRRSEPAR